MTTKKKCEALALELGVDLTLDRDSTYWGYDIETPKGFKLESTGHHVACGQAETKKEIWWGVWQDLQTVVPCIDDPDCIHECNE
jgi:hypothetical protein